MTIEEKIYALLVPGVIARASELTAPQGVATPYTVFFSVGQSPLETHQEALITSLRQWDLQFSSFATSPSLARAETKKILDYLTTYSDAGIRAVFLRPGTRTVTWEEETNLAHSKAEVTIWEALG